MSARMEKDALVNRAQRPQSQWKAADINEQKLRYPNGVLTLKCNSKQSRYHIARCTLASGSWSFKCWFLDEKNEFNAAEKKTNEEFLIGRSDEVCWKPLERGTLPGDSIKVVGKGDPQGHALIGKHIEFGIGPVHKYNGKFLYFYDGNRCDHNQQFELLCSKNNM